MPEPLLEVRALDAFYGDFQALFGVSLRVAAGEVVAVIGANGAGKSTLLKCIAGVIASRRDAILFDGEPIGDAPAHTVVARGIALVPEGRRLFSSLSVEENLLIGGQLGRPGPWSLPRLYELFPALAARRHQPSTSLSGGEQQMVALGRALMSNPRLLLCDEISLGLAPIIVREIYAGCRRSSPKAVPSSSSSRTSCRRSRRHTTSIACRRVALRSPVPPTHWRARRSRRLTSGREGL